jgi:transposase
MRTQAYQVKLTPAERAHLLDLISSGQAPARKLVHARLLLKADRSPVGPALPDQTVAEAVEVSQPTVARVRRQFVEGGLEAALNRRPPTRDYRRKLDGSQEARLIALACGTPPQGATRWTLRLLADRLVELAVVDDISYQTVRRLLKKTTSSPGGSSSG